MELLLDLLFAVLAGMGFLKVEERLKYLKTENPKWFWVVIGLSCWTLFVVVGPLLLLIIDKYRFSYTPAEWEEQLLYGAFCLCPIQVVLTVPALWVLMMVPRLVPRPKRYADFSPTPEEFADFERMLEETMEMSGTLICLECGHDNPVGQTNCEACGAWVPQTAKARWAHGGRTEES